MMIPGCGFRFMSQNQLQRRQVTLFLPEPESLPIEAIRQRFNPAQFALIAAHVTLIRDEDVPNWSRLRARAQRVASVDITLRFGAPIRQKNLVYLPSVGPTDDFDRLRRELLGDDHCRKQEPHISLIHPRNGKCDGEDFAAIKENMGNELCIRFQMMTFIEQLDGSAWRNVGSFPNCEPDS